MGPGGWGAQGGKKYPGNAVTGGDAASGRGWGRIQLGDASQMHQGKCGALGECNSPPQIPGNAVGCDARTLLNQNLSQNSLWLGWGGPQGCRCQSLKCWSWSLLVRNWKPSHEPRPWKMRGAPALGFQPTACLGPCCSQQTLPRILVGGFLALCVFVSPSMDQAEVGLKRGDDNNDTTTNTTTRRAIRRRIFPG